MVFRSTRRTSATSGTFRTSGRSPRYGLPRSSPSCRSGAAGGLIDSECLRAKDGRVMELPFRPGEPVLPVSVSWAKKSPDGPVGTGLARRSGSRRCSSVAPPHHPPIVLGTVKRSRAKRAGFAALDRSCARSGLAYMRGPPGVGLLGRAISAARAPLAAISALRPRSGGDVQGRAAPSAASLPWTSPKHRGTPGPGTCWSAVPGSRRQRWSGP
jgi:hypothetical protein